MIGLGILVAHATFVKVAFRAASHNVIRAHGTHQKKAIRAVHMAIRMPWVKQIH